jgi:riboflavin synthase
MFTGIIQTTARVAAVADGPMFRRVLIALDPEDVKLGDSIAINGVCLTVAEIENGALAFDVIKETLDKTNLGSLVPGDMVNVERSLRAGDRIDGHFVQGHVDGVGLLTHVVNNESEVRLTVTVPDHLAKYLVPKGSIAIDGVSLTIAEIKGHSFDVALIPTTMRLTNLGSRSPGWRFNLEADVLSKTIVHFLELRGT